MALSYPFLFPYGSAGWYQERELRQADRSNMGRKHIVMQEWYWYWLFARQASVNPLLIIGRLAMRYVVDAYAIVDQRRLDYFRYHQKNIRADLYKRVRDILANDDTILQEEGAAGIGKKIILPASYTSGD